MGSAAIRTRTPRVVTYLVWALLFVLAIGQPAAKGPSMAPNEVIGVHAGTDNECLQAEVYDALAASISVGRFATAQERAVPALLPDKLGLQPELGGRSGAQAAC